MNQNQHQHHHHHHHHHQAAVAGKSARPPAPRAVVARPAPARPAPQRPSSARLAQRPSPRGASEGQAVPVPAYRVSRPPSKKEVGNAGWTVIHSFAANFPQQPSDSDKYYARMLLKSISKLYPCKRCRYHFDKYLTSTPPDVSSRDAFVLWACTAHNDVNRRNGKPEFPCDIPSIDQRWGDCGCKNKPAAA